MTAAFSYCVNKSLFERDKELSYEVRGGVKFISASDRVGGVNQTSIRQRQRDAQRERERAEQTTNRLHRGWSLASLSILGHTHTHTQKSTCAKHTNKQLML